MEGIFSQTKVERRSVGKGESLSRSGQVLVRSPEAKMRSSMAAFAETVSLELGKILGDEKIAWVYPIEIETRGNLSDLVVSGRTMVTRVDLIEGDDLVLRLYVKLNDEFSRKEFAHEVLRLLLLERMLRGYKKGGDIEGKRLEVPAWVLSGVEGLIEYRRTGRSSDLYAGIVRSRQLLSVEEVLRGNPEKLDSLSRATYEASAAALLGALFAQQKGARNFGELLSELIFFEGDTSLLLKEKFSGLRGGEHSVDKWWALQIASMGELQAMEYLVAEETEIQLGEALRVKFSVANQIAAASGKESFWKKMIPFKKKNRPMFSNGRVHDFEQFYKHKDYKEKLEQNQLKLRALKYRAFPLYSPVIQDYEEVLERLLKGKRKNAAEDLQLIDEQRMRIGETMQQVADYLNYYEATQLGDPSADFERYFKTKERLSREKAPLRNDRISRYLDSIEKEYSEGIAP